MKRMAFRLAVTFVFVALTMFALLPTNIQLAGIPASAATQDDEAGWTKVVITFTFNDLQVNACYGDEYVDLTGPCTAVIWTKVQADGTRSIKEDWSIYMTGVGRTSQANYTFTDSSRVHINGIGSLPFSFEFTRVAKLIGDGVPDMKLHYKVKLTINADETITHNVNDFKANCNP